MPADAAATFDALVGDLEYPMYSTYRLGRESPALGVHLVPEHAAALGELFGGETGDEVDKSFLLEPVAAERGSDEGEFTFRRAKHIEPGHEP